MKQLRTGSKQKSWQNPHLIVLAVMLAAVSFFYYGWNSWFPWFREAVLFEFENSIMGSLFLLPLIYSAVFLRWGVLVVWLVFIIVITSFPLTVGFHSWAFIPKMIFSLTPMTFFVIIAVGFQWRRMHEIMDAEREKGRQAYLEQLSKAQEDERRRIAQELHDSTTQTLIVLAKRAQTLTLEDNLPSNIKGGIEWIRDQSLELADAVRRLSYDLRPSILDNIGLVPAIRWLANNMTQQAEMSFEMVQDSEIPKLSPELEVNIFRIVQEALNNITKHSAAKKVLIVLQVTDGHLHMKVQDDGKGFQFRDIDNSLATNGKLGIIGMQQRARFIDGKLDVVSEIGKGTTIALECALKRRA